LARDGDKVDDLLGLSGILELDEGVEGVGLVVGVGVVVVVPLKLRR